ncbi:MAG: hypothetical protein AAF591_16175 [Verrucomicrobiota bacterium]
MTSNPQKHRRLNLMPVIGVFIIIGFLAYLSWPKYHIPDNHREVAAKNDALGLVNAIKAFHTEYGHYPAEYTAEDTELQSTAHLMRILLAEEPDDTKKLNRRDIHYFSADKAKEGRGGITPEDDFHDPWGSPYQVIIDTNFDSQITNPETGEPMRSEVEAYSPGPDQNPNTWEDNIKTW